MRRRLVIKKRLQRRRLRALRTIANRVAGASKSGTYNFSLISAGLTDPFMDPPGDTDANYVEQSIRLPETFQCYDPLADVPVNPVPALTSGHINNERGSRESRD